MFGAAAALRIQEWILVREIVKAALGNDLENRQSVIAENADGQLASGNEFLDQKFADRISRASASAASISRSFFTM